MTADAPKVMWLVWLGRSPGGEYDPANDDEMVEDNQLHTIVRSVDIAIEVAKKIAGECERPCHVYRCDLSLHGTAEQPAATYTLEKP